MKLNKNVIKVVCFALIFCFLFHNVQAIFVQKKTFGYGKSEPNTNMIGGFYDEPSDSIDVLLLGSSSLFCNVNPLVMYNEYGISSYILGSSLQRLEGSYFLLKEGLKYQTPKVVVLDVYSALLSETSYNEAYNHYVFDNSPLSFNKIKSVYESLEIANNDKAVNYIFPLVKYHMRWKNLTREDFVVPFHDKRYSLKGYYARYDIVTTDNNRYYSSSSFKDIPERNKDYLEKIITECQKNDIQLLCIKTPMPANWREKHTEVFTQYFEEKGIPFLDYHLLIDVIDLNDKADFFDDGKHLNDNGATKVSLHLGEYLKCNYNLHDYRDDNEFESWKDDYFIYQQDKTKYYLANGMK